MSTEIFIFFCLKDIQQRRKVGFGESRSCHCRMGDYRTGSFGMNGQSDWKAESHDKDCQSDCREKDNRSYNQDRDKGS